MRSTNGRASTLLTILRTMQTLSGGIAFDVRSSTGGQMRRDRACVLIVEDNADWKGVLREALHLFGYRVLEADTAHSGIQTATAERPDLILLDLRLPDMEGTVAARILKKRMETAHIPIIGCSAYLDPEWKDRAFRSGMIEYLQKPVSLHQIAAVIERVLCGDS